MSNFAVIVGPIIAAVEAGLTATPGPYRPTEWTTPALVSVTVPATVAGKTATVYVFDAVLKLDHKRELQRTKHPIQASATSPVAAISDHAFKDPARVTLEIGMSDAMESYAPGMWTSNASKSVSAFQTLVSLQDARALVTLTTRLATYGNMLVESIQPTESSKTLHGLRAVVVFSQIFLAQLSASEVANSGGSSASGSNASEKNVGGFIVADGQQVNATGTWGPSDSARPQTTDSSPLGTQQPGDVPDAITSQHEVAPSAVPGAGDWSSSNIGGGL
jgi:hypothetical protein